MKFQFKALAAALVLAASSVPAHATVALASSGNSSLILTVLDRVAGVSATFDLGKNYSDYNQFASAGAVADLSLSGVSMDLANNFDYKDAWAQLFSSGATTANLVFQVEAADNLGTGAGSRGYVTSYRTGGTTITSSGLTTALGNFDTYLSNAVDFGQTLTSNHDLVSNGSSALNTGFGYAGTAFYAAPGRAGNSNGAFSFGAIGTTMSMAQYVTSASSLSVASSLVFANTSTVTLSSNGLLTITPVPEADTYAMMVLGLGLVGFASRRKAK